MIKENKYPLKGTLSFSSLVCSSGAGGGDLQFAHWRFFQIGESSECRSAWLLLLSENDGGIADQLLSFWHFNKKRPELINDQTPVSFLFKHSVSLDSNLRSYPRGSSVSLFLVQYQLDILLKA